MHFLRAVAQVVQGNANHAKEHGEISDPLRGAFPEADHPGNVRLFRQPAIGLGIGYIVQHIDDARSAHARRIIDPRLLEAIVLAKLPGPSFGQILHVVFGAEVQTAGGARLDARWFQSLAHPVHTQRALEHLLGLRIELGNIEGAAADAISAANTILLLKIDNAVGVLHDRAVGGTSRQTAGIGAVHALVFAHQQRDAAVFTLVLVELDQIPVIPRRLRHGLVAVVEDRVGEGVAVPLQAGDFTGFAADAGRSVDQLAHQFAALDVFAGRWTSVAGNPANC